MSKPWATWLTGPHKTPHSAELKSAEQPQKKATMPKAPPSSSWTLPQPPTCKASQVQHHRDLHEPGHGPGQAWRGQVYLGLAVPGVDALAQALGRGVQAAPICSSPIGAGQGQVVPQLVGRPQNAQGVVLQLLHTGSAPEGLGHALGWCGWAQGCLIEVG